LSLILDNVTKVSRQIEENIWDFFFVLFILIFNIIMPLYIFLPSKPSLNEELLFSSPFVLELLVLFFSFIFIKIFQTDHSVSRLKHYVLHIEKQMSENQKSISSLGNDYTKLLDEFRGQNSFLSRLMESNDTDTGKAIGTLSLVPNNLENIESKTILSVYENIASEYSHSIKTPLSSIEDSVPKSSDFCISRLKILIRNKNSVSNQN
jgi:hypothetical protein